MTKQGLKVAIQNSLSLPSFTSQEVAEESLFNLRDEMRELIVSLDQQWNIGLDFSPNSLKKLEKWYFELLGSDNFHNIELTRKEFEIFMGFYIGFVYIENDPEFSWVVEESPFAEDKYRIGVTKGLFTRMMGRIQHLEKLKDNKRMQSLFREYKQYA